MLCASFGQNLSVNRFWLSCRANEQQVQIARPRDTTTIDNFDNALYAVTTSRRMSPIRPRLRLSAISQCDRALSQADRDSAINILSDIDDDNRVIAQRIA